MNTSAALSAAQQAAILAEALPYIQGLHGRTVVLRLAGSCVSDAALRNGMAADVALLQLVGIHLVLVHDAGVQGAENAAALSAANQAIVAAINRRGGRSVGLNGLDGPLIHGLRAEDGRGSVIGRIDAELIHLLKQRNFVPVIMPIASGEDGAALVVGADLVASRLAESLQAERLIVLADSPGVPGPDGLARPGLSLAEAQGLLDEAPLDEALRLRLAAVVAGLKGGVKSAQLTDGRIQEGLLLEVLSNAGVGSLISARGRPDFGADTRRYFAGD